MNFLNAFNNQPNNFDLSNEVEDMYTPKYADHSEWEVAFTGFKTQPVLYNMDGYISPYAYENWGNNTKVITILDDNSRIPLNNNVDPNKIFNSDIAALRALAADQVRITKLFEKKLNESLTDKNKFGLTEEDIMAMQAVTSARSAITSINKEQVAIKKNIAELKIKQQNNAQQATQSAVPGQPVVSSNPMSVGKSMLDTIFESNFNNMSQPPIQQNLFNTVSVDQASDVLDSLLPQTSAATQIEALNATTYVVIPQNGNEADAEYRTYDSEGNIIEDIAPPSFGIVSVNRDTKLATDQVGQTFPIKII